VDLLLKDIVLDGKHCKPGSTSSADSGVTTASPSHKQVITRTLMIPADISARMKQDPSLRLLLFANVDQPLSAYSLHDVTFPSQLEVRVNNDEVRANFKGLKNKPGSTRPADITDYVRKTPPNYRNQLQITYALTQRVGVRLFFCEKVRFFADFRAEVHVLRLSGEETLRRGAGKTNNKGHHEAERAG
jgi:hypothetical protein